MTREFDFQPTLTGPRLTLRPVVAEDWEGMFAAASDPELWALHPATDRYQEPVFREFFQGALDSGSAFSVLDRQSNSIIGSSRYSTISCGENEVEIGWTFLAREYWGGSYNLEIKKLMLEHAFKFVDIVILLVGDENIRSRKAVMKIGGVLRPEVENRTLNGKDHIHLIYEIQKENYTL